MFTMTPASLVSHMVKNLLTMQENWVRSLGQDDPLEKGMAMFSSILAWRIPWTEEPGGYSPWDHKESDTLLWPQERPVPMRVARGPLGIPLLSMLGPKTLCSFIAQSRTDKLLL